MLPKPPLQLTARLSTSLLVLTAIFAVAGCDRVEGQLKDAAHGAVERTSSFARENLVSDMQKDAEAKCISALTNAPLPREPLESWVNKGQVIQLSPVKFELAKAYPLKVRVLGDGKYEIQVSLFEEGAKQGLHIGRCTVVAGKVTEHGVP